MSEKNIQFMAASKNFVKEDLSLDAITCARGNILYTFSGQRIELEEEIDIKELELKYLKNNIPYFIADTDMSAIEADSDLKKTLIVAQNYESASDHRPNTCCIKLRGTLQPMLFANVSKNQVRNQYCFATQKGSLEIVPKPEA
ncbi:MAG: hypothetical protein ACT4OY_05920 [Alphaproteobacteria bacterium]